jgi:hypothetical protein
MASVLDVGAEYTVTEKTTVIKSMTEALIADIIKIDLLIIPNYITSDLWKQYILDFVSHVVDLVGYRTSFVISLAYLSAYMRQDRERHHCYTGIMAYNTLFLADSCTYKSL